MQSVSATCCMYQVRFGYIVTSTTRARGPRPAALFRVILVLEALRDRAGTGNELVTALSGLRATRLNSTCFGKSFGRTGPAWTVVKGQSSNDSPPPRGRRGDTTPTNHAPLLYDSRHLRPSPRRPPRRAGPLRRITADLSAKTTSADVRSRLPLATLLRR